MMKLTREDFVGSWICLGKYYNLGGVHASELNFKAS